MFNFEDANKFNKDAMDSMMKSYTVASKNFQAIATEVADFSKKSMEANVAHVEKLMSMKSIESAAELQTSFAKSAVEDLVAEVTKIGDMYSNLAKESYKPYEGTVAKAAAAVKATVEKAADAAAA